MFESWNNKEIELLTILRPLSSLNEIKKIFDLLSYNRSLKSIKRKSERLKLNFKEFGYPNIELFDKTTSEAIQEILNERIGNSSCLPVNPHPEGFSLKQITTLANNKGESVLQWHKVVKNENSREQVLQKFIKEIPELILPKKEITPLCDLSYHEDILSVYPIGDPHIGMLAWGEESGEDFDHKIARSYLISAMNYLVSQSFPTKNALIINLGDFFHTDNMSNVTLRSKNSLDVDSRWAKILRVGLAVKVNMIELALKKHENIRVIIEIGNHDDHTSMFLAVALDAFYRNESRVSIDMSPAKFHYHKFGKNLIGVTHGDTIKPQDLESIMSCDKSKEWGESTNRYWYIGHIHHSRKWEFRGCTVESFRTLAPKDAWHAAHGYRSRCDMTKIMLHKEYGELFRTTIDSVFLKSLFKGT